MPGEEILIADANARDRAGMAALAEKKHLVVTQADNADLARDRIARKFFTVALIDLDLPGGGTSVIEFARERSPATQIVALASRKNFDGAVAAFRSGAVDVVSKLPAELPRLERSIDLAIDKHYASQGQGMRGVTDTLDDLAKLVINLARQVYASEIESLTEVSKVVLRVLFVDEDTSFLKELSAQVASLPMDAFVELSGGGALDKLGAHSFDIVVVKDGLGDLPGTIVVNAAQQRNPECVALVYSVPGPEGWIDRVVDGKQVDRYTPFNDAGSVAERVKQLVDEENTRRRERKVLQVVGGKHGEVLRKYADVKRRLEAMQGG